MLRIICTSMATRILERPKQSRKLAGTTAPRTYPLKWVAILLASDIALFVIASDLGALIGFHHWNSPRIVSHLLIAEVIFVALWVFVFDRLGLYRRTYALSMKDELYYTVAALGDRHDPATDRLHDLSRDFDVAHRPDLRADLLDRAGRIVARPPS